LKPLAEWLYLPHHMIFSVGQTADRHSCICACCMHHAWHAQLLHAGAGSHACISHARAAHALHAAMCDAVAIVSSRRAGRGGGARARRRRGRRRHATERARGANGG
jgi:hypothetical protein